MVQRIHTAKKDLGESGEAEEVAGINRLRNVDKWTPNTNPNPNPPTPPSSNQVNLGFLRLRSKVPGSEE
jgi:hypothetical protein